MNCEFCRSPVHIWFQCPKKPDGWKPARLAKVRIGTTSPDRPATPKSDVSALPPHHEVHTQSTAPSESGSRRSRSANESLPVDTPKRGRPSTGFDKRAYNKQYMADRRAGKR